MSHITKTVSFYLPSEQKQPEQKQNHKRPKQNKAQGQGEAFTQLAKILNTLIILRVLDQQTPFNITLLSCPQEFKLWTKEERQQKIEEFEKLGDFLKSQLTLNQVSFLETKAKLDAKFFQH